MKKADLITIVNIVKNAKLGKLEIIYLMNTLQRVKREPDLKDNDIWNDFKERCDKE